MTFCDRLARCLVLTVGLAAWGSTVHAACSDPHGEAGRIMYASNLNMPVFCNGTNWVSMAGWNNSSGGGASFLNELTDVDTTAVTTGSILAYNGTSWVVSSTGGSAELGDRIVSGSTSIVANQNQSLTFTTAGNQRMLLGANGFLGVGTDTPVQRLTVVEDNTGGIARFNSTAVSQVARIIIDRVTPGGDSGLTVMDGGNSQWTIGQRGGVGNAFMFSTGGNFNLPKVTFTKEGSVGISTSTPLAKLDVVGTISASDAVQIGTSSLICGGGIAGAIRYDAGSLELCNGTVWGALGGGQTDRITSGTHAVTVNTASGNISLTTAGTSWGYLNGAISYLPTLAAGRVSATNVSASIVHVSGNVGIGTTTPGAFLDVNGNQGGTTSLKLRSGDTSAFPADSNQIVFEYNGGTQGYAHAIKTRHHSGGVPNNAIDFFVWDQTTDAVGAVGTKHVMTMNGEGRVGIGISSPKARLDVVGTISASDAIQIGTSALTCANPISGSIRYNAGSLELCNGTSWGPLGGGGGGATDRITSGTHAVTVNTASGMVSLTTGGTSWGYLSGGISYLPTLMAARVSATNISVTIVDVMGQVQGNTNDAVGAPTYSWSGRTTTGMYSPANNQIGFATNGTETMRIAGNNVGIGTTTPSTSLYINGQIAGGFGAHGTGGVLDFDDITNARSGQGQTLLRGSTASNTPVNTTAYWHAFSFEYNQKLGGGNLTQFAIPYTDANSIAAGMFMRFRHSGNWTGWHKFITSDPSGNAVVANNMTAAAFLYSSDRRLKMNIRQLPAALKTIDALSPVTFTYTSDTTHRERIGFIAQEVEKAYPQAVVTDANGMKSVDYPSLVPVLAGAVKELKVQAASLQTQNEGLMSSMAALKHQNAELIASNISLTTEVEGMRKTYADLTYEVAMMRENAMLDRLHLKEAARELISATLAIDAANDNKLREENARKAVRE